MLAIVVLGCTGTAPPPAAPPAPTGPVAPRPEDAPWRWDYAQADFSDTETVLLHFDHVVFDRTDIHHPVIRRLDAEDHVIWEEPIPEGTNRTTLLVSGNDLFAASWDVEKPGGQLAKLAADTGDPVWTVPIEALHAPAPTGGYFNRMQVWTWEDWLVVYGDESPGRYTEVHDPADGKLLANRAEPPE
jgi:hypothetical protein